MPHVRTQHPNASLTPLGRRKMVRLVIDDGWTIEAAADKLQVDAKTVTIDGGDSEVIVAAIEEVGFDVAR